MTTGRNDGAARPPLLALGLLALPLLLLAGFPAGAVLYTDWRWFRSLGHADVFTTLLATKLGLGFGVGLGAFVFLLANVRVAIRSSQGLGSFVFADAAGAEQLDFGRVGARLAPLVAALFAFLLGSSAANLWETWLRFRHGGDFGAADPLFGRDVGFYVFDLPVYESLAAIALWLLVLSLALTAGLHFARGGIVSTPRGLRVHPRARLHLGALGAALFLLLAVRAWLAQFGLFSSDLGPVTGASYADVHARLPALRVQIAAAAVGAALVLVGALRGRTSFTGVAVVLYFGVEVLGVRALPSLVHRFTVLPNEAEKEAPFIEHNIAATRAAYGLQDVADRELTGEGVITWSEVERNRATTENVRLWDHEPLLDTFAQIQEIRTYYDFKSVDNDRYVIDGALRQTMLSPRELAAESLPKRTWINEHFVFTHGYGVTLGPVNEATPEGLPVLFVQDIPPTSSKPTLEVTQPAIYFGEKVNDYVFVRTETREFDYPSGEDNVYAEYEGRAGVRLDSVLTKAAMAARLGSFKVLLSEDLTPESRVLLHRNVRERVAELAPFLRWDRDPYMVVRDDGRLAWIHDAYTLTSRYPYAEPARSDLNYIRNSVKAVVDAYDGTVTYYAADPDDPILAAWRRAFPTLFRELADMPADLRAHLRYPEDVFRIQTEVFATYHMESAELLYNREDQWEIPAIASADETRRLEPYYTVMRLPGEDEAEFILMLPFTPQRKQNLAAWMVARMDGDRLGELVVYRFPKDRLVFGPQQIMNRINQDADIARQVSLWDQRGSQAIFGTLLVIPIEESLIYVVPLYLRAEGGRIPELKRVIVAYENQIAMEPTLDGALSTLFGSGLGEGTGETHAEQDDGEGAVRAEGPATDEGQRPTAGEGGPLATRARDLYQRAVEAQRAGDWAGYGEALEQLGETLERLTRAAAGPDAGAPAEVQPDAVAPSGD